MQPNQNLTNTTTTWANIMQLRTYQTGLIKSINESFTHHDRILLQLPTGGGKTVIFSNVLQRYVRAQRRVLILSHRTELVHQAAATVTALTGRPVGIIKSGIKPEPQHLTQSASVQTLKNRTGDYPDFDLIVIDEAHHTPAASYRKILDASLMPRCSVSQQHLAELMVLALKTSLTSSSLAHLCAS